MSRRFAEQVDFGRTASDYGRHRVGFPDALYGALERAGVVFAGRRVLDLCSGTGDLARGLAARGATPVALDRAGLLLARARETGITRTVLSDAHHVPFADDAFDHALGGQCWHWLDAKRAALQLRRVVRPGGTVSLCSYDWVPEPGSVVAATERLILEFNPEWTLSGGDGFHPEYARGLAGAGLELVAVEGFDHPAIYEHGDWRGRIRASAGVGASLCEEEVRRFDGELARVLGRDFPDDPLSVPHRVFLAVARVPS